MPRISDRILSAVAYIYPDEESARRGDPRGGTGFLVCLPMEGVADAAHLFVATANHVVGYMKAAWLRVSTTEGTSHTIEIPAAAWISHPDGDDVAIAGIDRELDADVDTIKCIPNEWLITHDLLSQLDLGPGDETFFVGRFKHHDGRDVNRPSARFGNISLMPGDVHIAERGLAQEAFIVEARSLSGYSGSPVFVFLPPMTPRPSQVLDPGQRIQLEKRGAGPLLLGVDCAHLRDSELVRDGEGHPVDDGLYVQSNSGMLAVVPAWKLSELFANPESRDFMQRDRESWTS